MATSCRYAATTRQLVRSVAFPRPSQRRLEGLWQFGAKLEPLAAPRMLEREPRGVQELSLESVAAAGAVLGIAGHGVVDCGEVDSDLVGSACLQPGLDERVGGQPLDHLEAGARLARAGSAHRHPGAASAVPAERRVDRARAAAQMALDEGGVLPLHLAALHRGRERLVGFVVPSDDHQARGVLVEAVHDPRPAALSPARDPLHQVDQRLAAVRGRRVDDEAGGLLDHREILVEVNDQALDLWLHSFLRLVSERSTSSNNKRTPSVIARSARLKVGQSGRSMKSVTAPSRTRSARFPSAPPSSSAAGSQTPQPLAPRAARKTSRPIRRRIVTPIRAAEMSPPSPNATPLFRTFSMCSNGSTSIRSPRSTRDVASALVPWSKATTTPQAARPGTHIQRVAPRLRLRGALASRGRFNRGSAPRPRARRW